MQEIWKDVKDFKNIYQISNFGKIRNVKTNRLLKPFKNTNGYYQINLWSKNKRKHILIHKLVAETFIPNPSKLPFINHKNENKLDNKVDNLEWCTAKYNCNYGTRNARLSRPVICIELNKKYKSIQEASQELNIQKAHISGCCLKKRHYNTAGGYHWEYVKEA